MAFLDTTPTALVIQQPADTRGSRLDPTAAYRVTIDRYGYVLEAVPDGD